MQNLMKHFVRLGPGTWTCVDDDEYRGPQGRIQITAGTIVTKGKHFMGVDLAALLERELQMQSDKVIPFHFQRQID
jgi:hypothetical protein